MKIDSLNILGTEVLLIWLQKNETKGLAVGVIVEFYLYDRIKILEKILNSHTFTKGKEV